MITSEEIKRDIAIICTIISYLNPQELDLKGIAAEYDKAIRLYEEFAEED